MGHVKVRRRKKQQSIFKPTYWLPVVVMGALVLIGVVVILSGQKNKTAISPSAPARFDPSFTPQVTDAPRVMVPQDAFDYGDVQLGKTVTTVFEVRNMGDKPLAILGEPQVEVVEGC